QEREQVERSRAGTIGGQRATGLPVQHGEHPGDRDGDRPDASLPFRPEPVAVRVDLKENRLAGADEEVEGAVPERHRGRERLSGRDYRWRRRRVPYADPLRVGPGRGRPLLADLESVYLAVGVIDAQLGLVLDVLLHDDRRPGGRAGG